MSRIEQRTTPLFERTHLETPPGEIEHHLAERIAMREQRSQSDADITQKTARLLDHFVADMFSILESLQLEARNNQSKVQEQDSRSRATSASQAHAQKVQELEQAIRDRMRASESDFFGNLFRVIASVVSAVVGALGAVFTGGASLVAAIATIVALIGPMVMNLLADAGVVDRASAQAVSIGIAAVATVVSFGASAASLAGAIGQAAVAITDTAIRSAIEVFTQIGTLVSAAGQIASGAFTINSALLRHSASQHEIQASQHHFFREAEREAQEEAIEVMRSILKAFARTAESLRNCREEQAAATRAALIAC
ncbi:MAG: hypothetical protein NZM37_01620 [Sandaracinaceae bacterium]|nr:hypothetical protein [Sandaracinaceae bacterium]